MSSYATAGILLEILEVRKPSHPVQSTFVKVEIPTIGGLITNIDKTKYIYLGTDKNHLDFDNGDIITGCIEFRNLDPYIPKTEEPQGNTSTENSRCIKWGMVVKKRNKKTGKRLYIYNNMIKSVLNYGAETWSFYEDDMRRIDAAEKDALRRSARISKLNRKTNEYIREKMNKQNTILDEITRKQLIW